MLVNKDYQNRRATVIDIVAVGEWAVTFGTERNKQK